MKEELYTKRLQIISKKNKKGKLKVLLVKEDQNSSGTTICICPTVIHLPIAAKKLHNELKSVYVMNCTTNPSDFELPIHMVSIFRSYPWPFVNKFDDYIIDLFRNTYTGKGLKRKCTYH